MRSFVPLVLISIILLANHLYATNASAGSSDTPVFLELFTSQSCSSCPPADRLLEKLSAEPNVIVLGCHVDYWNHLAWEDTLTSHACTARQRAYAAAFGARGVYTPQLLINGDAEALGSDERAIRKLMKDHAGSVASIEFKLSGDGVMATLPALTRPDTGKFVIEQITFGPNATVHMKAGENTGSTITYANPARDFKEIGEWDGAPRTISLPIPRSSENLAGVIVIVRTQRNGSVVSAGKFHFTE